MADPLFGIKKDKCIQCYACVRICPVKAIKVDPSTEFPDILSERCIGCGSCFRMCPASTIHYRSSLEETKAILASGNKVAAICDPSISGEFDDITDYRKFVEMIRQLGFTYVSEASFGVDLVADQYRNLFEEFHGKYYIMSNCPAVVSFIEKYYPSLINNLAPVVSPMIATSKVVHQRYGNDVKTVFIGPCIATKDEALLYEGDGKVDSVLTFTELRQLFEEFNIRESQLEFSDFDPPLGYKGSLYPLSNGIIQTAGLNEDLLTGRIITTEGRNNMLDAVSEFDTRIDTIQRHFNIFYNEGCLMGPGTSPSGKKFLRRTLVIDYANKRLKNFDYPNWEKNKKDLSLLDFSRTFHENDQRLPDPDEEVIHEILKRIGKEEQLKNHIGCESCGYTSCREFAVAIAQGLATTEMCQSYTASNRQEYIQTLRSTNDKLAKTQAALKDSEEKARQEREMEKQTSEAIDAMLQKLISGVVIVDENLRITHSNKAFVRILGEEAAMVDEVIPGLVGADLKSLLPVPFYKLFSFVLSGGEDIEDRDVRFGEGVLSVSIFTITKMKMVGAIIRDLYKPEMKKEQIVRRLSEVVDQNFEMVQKIAFLLGEGAAKTEKLLNSVIESQQTPPKKPEI
ncbi:MAG: [Fe-Fe] hydrogenase large subunit C-terminal domain-containing protein [Bacteroidota bacterium]|nr:[Fe-Fe] hydrogenase large subunit C-terminal domain-containing protein [Bacteroidota bacterium]